MLLDRKAPPDIADRSDERRERLPSPAGSGPLNIRYNTLAAQRNFSIERDLILNR